MRRNKQINVSRALALASAFNFLISAAKACLLPFLTLYFRHLGLTPTETGFVIGARYLITLVWSPMASLLSKLYDKRRVLINGSLVASAAVALFIPFIPPADMHKLSCNMTEETVRPTQSLLTRSTGLTTQVSLAYPAKLENASSGMLTHFANVSLVGSTSQGAKVTISFYSSSTPVISKSRTTNASSTAVRKKRSNVEIQDNSKEKSILADNTENHLGFLSSLKAMDIQHQLFFLILVAISVYTVALAPIEWTVDDGLYEYLDLADASDRYSNSKTWSVVGAACGVGGAGLLVSLLSCVIAAETPRSVVHFVCYAVVAVVTIPVASFLPLYLNRKRSRENGLIKGIQLVRGSVRALLCAVTTLLVGIEISTIENFLLWEMHDNGSNELHMGLSLALGLLSQVAFPLFVGRISKLLSPGRILVVGAATLGTQCFYYSFLWGPWAVLPAQFFNILSSGALWWAVQVQSNDVATPGTERSVNRVYCALCLDLGRALGSIIGGLVAQKFGIPWMFRGAALGLMAWCMLLPLLQLKAPRQRRINYSRLLAAEASEASESESEQERDWLDKAMEDDRSNNNYGRRMHP